MRQDRSSGQAGGSRGARSRSRRRRSRGRRPNRPAAAGDSRQGWPSRRPRPWSHCVVVCAGSRSTRSLSWIQVNNFYITTPIYYVNSTPHIGHAYTTIVADILTRHHKQRGDETFFLTGTDEHGSKVYRVAEEQGLDPKTYVDQIAEAWKELPRLVDADYDFFIRTTDEGHKRFVQEFIQRIYDNGYIYQDVYSGLYCVGCEEFKAEAELVDGKCPIHGTVPERIEETNYFFKLSAFQQPLLDLYDTRPDFVLPRFRYNEARSFIEGGLQDFSLSRAGHPWGVPVPWDDSQVVYVGRCAHQLCERTDLRTGGRGPPREVLARGAPPAGQGHPALPLCVLARSAFGSGLRGSEAALRTWLAAARRHEDLEVRGERHRPARSRRRVRQRRRPFLGRACRFVRAGRKRHAREPPRALRARACERPGQSRLTHDGDDRPLPRGTDSGRDRSEQGVRRDRRGQTRGANPARRVRRHRCSRRDLGSRSLTQQTRGGDEALGAGEGRRARG